MRHISVLAALIITAFSYSANAADIKYYNYANNYSEYSVMLPAAPAVSTIWADGKDPIPYLTTHPDKGSLGEVASYNELDAATGENIIIEITFLKTDKAFLDTLNKDTMLTLIKNDIKGVENLSDTKENYSEENGGVTKHSSFAGIFSDDKGKPIYRVEHVLTGKASIYVIKARYNLENVKFNEYYKKIVSSIKYLPL